MKADRLRGPSDGALVAIGVLAVLAAGMVMALRLTSEFPGDEPGLQAALLDWIVLSYVFSGLVAWRRRPDSRFGPLMIAAGFATSLSSLASASNALLFTVGQAMDLVPFDRMPLVFAFVLGLAFVLMLVTFRSVVIPVKTIVLNLLSVGAAYGILTLVFQKGWGEELLGFESNGGVTNWLPVFLFVILFGLSMDYHVFILSRVREAYDRGMTTEQAVRTGIAGSAGTVTAAAVVMVLVFSVFATRSFIDFKEMGVGLAAAILIDATIIRGVLLPATMKLLGDWNWWLPRSLAWLPRVRHEATARTA